MTRDGWIFVAVLMGALAFGWWTQTEAARGLFDEMDAAAADTTVAAEPPPRPEPPESYPTLLVCLDMMGCEPVIEAVAGKRCGRVSHPWSESPDTVYLECVETRRITHTQEER